MTLLVLFFLGAAIGWLAAIMLGHDSLRQSMIDILAGTFGSLAAYLAGGGHADSPAISVDLLLVGALGAAATVAAGAIFRHQFAR